MKYLRLETFTDFVCIGSKCPYTCCAGGWGIPVDDQSFSCYKNVDGEFGDKLSKNIYEDNGIYYFKLTDNERCPFLDTDNLCDIYINLGPEYLCYTCKVYPRFGFLEGDVEFAGVGISCPVVAKTVLINRDKLQLDFVEDEKNYNSIEVDWDFFNQSIRAFSTLIEIAQDRNFLINERLAITTLFAYKFQEYVDTSRDSTGLIELFSDHANFPQLLNQTGIYLRDIATKANFLNECIKAFKKVSGIKNKLPLMNEVLEYFRTEDRARLDYSSLEKAFSFLDDIEAQGWMEQLLVYVIFRYFMQGFENKDFYNQFMIGIILVYEYYISMIALYYLRWDRMPDIDEMAVNMSHVSRLVEHGELFQLNTIKSYNEKGITELSYLFKLYS